MGDGGGVGGAGQGMVYGNGGVGTAQVGGQGQRSGGDGTGWRKRTTERWGRHIWVK